jgi:hypothetical protein
MRDEDLAGRIMDAVVNAVKQVIEWNEFLTY